MHELCKWTFTIFELAEQHTTNLFDPRASDGNNTLVHDFKLVVDTTERLMNWPGWNDWHDCDQ